jgi:crotonobetaine/carnitine-CoA ligase
MADTETTTNPERNTPYDIVSDMEDDIRCVIIQRSGAALQPAELLDWLQPRMPYFMLPRYIEFVDDMPRTPSAKIEKYKLVEAGLSAVAWDREKAGYRIERSAPKTAKA